MRYLHSEISVNLLLADLLRATLRHSPTGKEQGTIVSVFLDIKVQRPMFPTTDDGGPESSICLGYKLGNVLCVQPTF
uniref:Uncharacterized protein n=1 Tax=Arundo donax TaxID=35708 RepID=A0A0A9D7V6_ARUDO